MKNMRSMTKIALLLLVVAAGSGARAQTTQTVAPGVSYTFTATAASGGGTISYQWYRNGEPISGATSQNYNLPANEATGTAVEFKRAATSSVCPLNTSYTGTYIVTFSTGSSGGGGTTCPLTIGSICWASANVDASGVFAAKPDMNTQFYQWNRTTAWAATGSVSGWNSTADQATTWSVNPCPSGWRLPSQTEFQALHDGSTPAGGTWAAANAKGNSVAGCFYGPSSASCTLSNMTGCIFLPAVGYRTNSGTLNRQGSGGNYWSSTQDNAAGGYGLSFGSSSSSSSNSYDKAYGFSVRCVQ